MSTDRIIRIPIVPAAFLAAGTLLLISCGNKAAEPTIQDPETTPTQISHNHRIVNSLNGVRQYRMETPLLERYELAEEPFMEFTEGIRIETFTDSLQIENDIVADYAHFNETKELWTAKGNVIARNHLQDRTLFTERLYWDQAAKKIYSDTLSRVIDGGSVHIGRNFEADENFETWSFRNTVGQLEVDADFAAGDETRPADSLPPAPAADSLARPAAEAPGTIPEPELNSGPEPAGEEPQPAGDTLL